MARESGEATLPLAQQVKHTPVAFPVAFQAQWLESPTQRTCAGVVEYVCVRVRRVCASTDGVVHRHLDRPVPTIPALLVPALAN
jgi:hypothetical protein